MTLNAGTDSSEESIESVNRRRFLQATGAVGATGLAGCTGLLGGGGEDGVEYWTLFGGGDGDTMEAMVDDINESDDHDLHINRQRVPHDEYYDRLYTSLTGDEFPDLAVMHADMMMEYQDLVTPLTDDIDDSAYVENILDEGYVDGELLAVPLDTHPLAMYYNKELFEEAGLDPEEPPNTPERFQEACEAIEENTDSWAFQYHGGDFSVRYLRMFLAGLGSQILTDDFEPAFDNEDGLAVVQEMHDWVHEHGWAPDDSDTGWDAWNRGEAGMIIEGTWHVGVVQEAGFDFGLTEPFIMPGTENPVTRAGSHMLIVPENEDRDEERYEETVEAIRLLTQEYNSRWGTEAGHLPGSQEALESDELRESELWDLTLETFYEMVVENEQVVYPPATPNNEAYVEQIYQPLDDMRSGNLTPEETIENASEGVSEVFE